MDSIALLREQIREAHDWLEATMADVTPAQAGWVPPGTANPLGATYAHAITVEDMVVNGMLKGTAPLGSSTWSGKTGLDHPMPAPGPDFQHYPAWTRSVKVQLPALRQYAQAVYASTEQYLASLKPADLDRKLDLSGAGMGEQTLAWVLNRLILGHIDNMCGEVSVLKGVQGGKGYPM
jgi:hypothetical protein